MNERKRPTRRLVVNGRRLLEGQDNDWYPEGDKIVLGIRLRQGDVVVMEYNDFSEEVLTPESLWRPCHVIGCPWLIPAVEERCKSCEIKRQKEDICKVLQGIEDRNRRAEELNKLDLGQVDRMRAHLAEIESGE